MARAAWHGSRIVVRQVSPESPDIFDFIMDLHRACSGDWNTLVAQCEVLPEELEAFLEYAATFLCKLGNYYGEGDQKFVPDLSIEALHRIAAISAKAKDGLHKIIGPLLTVPPFSLGYPSKSAHLDAFQESQKAWVTDVSEWEAMIGIADPEEASRLKRLVESSTTITQHLPWAVDGVNDGKGPFEKSLFEAPDFTSVHALAVCGSIVFEAANLPNYEYIRETCGFKNVVLVNRLSANNNPKLPCYWQNPPISPISGKPVTSHYLLGQTWGSVFGRLVGMVEECRAILVSEYLMDDKKLLGIFGYTDDSEIIADDCTYTTANAHFSILEHLLQDGGGVIRIAHDPTESSLTVHVDRRKFVSHGKLALGRYLCRLHIWRCTADVASCKEFYEPLCAIEGEYEWKFVQPNTLVNGDVVEMEFYEESNKGIIQSWFEREV
ncbi:peptidase family M49-domain-containing protein [Lasiosphaeria ovina]|uniref:Peptidase family M49-domain-containing protein n=1 Tax=Lasiosphaeria ovina TaxID=92902 RepID=A0AAE0JZ66_9PEZI|nr:peptidase family M49-domain-containing protein [Lasiosphaeria ovina]